MADLEIVSGEQGGDNGGETVRCRYCGQLNQTKGEGGRAVCGRCRLPLSDAPHKKFADLDKHSYVHPLDSRALAALKTIPGIDTALKKLLEVTGESAIRVIFTASAVKVTPKQCPDLYAKLQVACTTLGVDMPELFVQQNPIVNAFTGGVKHPVIVLHSQLIERLNDEEVLAVIAHERDPVLTRLLVVLEGQVGPPVSARHGGPRRAVGRSRRRIAVLDGEHLSPRPFGRCFLA